ncbi:MAG: hypothetical protein ABL308_04490 [Oceanicaulis sp.]
MISLDSEFKNRLRVQLDGEEVEQLTRIELTIANIGNVPILNQRVEITLEDGSELLDISTICAPPIQDDELHASGAFATATVEAKYLNPSDNIECTLVYKGSGGIAKIYARNVGVKDQIVERKEFDASMIEELVPTHVGFMGFMFPIRTLARLVTGATGRK